MDRTLDTGSLNVRFAQGRLRAESRIMKDHVLSRKLATNLVKFWWKSLISSRSNRIS